MAKYLKRFNTTAEYTQYVASDDYVRPNVSVCEDGTGMKYGQITRKLTAIFNVTDTSSPTMIAGGQGISAGTSGFSAVKIDGVEQPTVESAYTFDTTGEHTVEYTLKYPKKIPSCAFSGCTALTSVVIPDTVKIIGMSAFAYCDNLSRVNSDVDGFVNIPNGVTAIDSGNFVFNYNNPNITIKKVKIPNSVTKLRFVFCSYMSGLEDVIIGNGIKGVVSSIAPLSFVDKDTLQYSNRECFASCPNVTSVTFAEDSKLENYAGLFQSLNSLSSITIPDSVQTIAMLQGLGSTAMTDIKMSRNIEQLGPSLQTVNFPNVPTVYDGIQYVDNIANNTVDNTLSTYTVKDGTRIIAGNAYKNCSSITSVGPVGSGADVEIPDSVVSIYGFSGCTNITDVLIPKTVKHIGNVAFSNCGGITSFKFESGSKLQKLNGFYGLSGLTSIGPEGSGADFEIPNSVTYMDYGCFRGCSGLTDVTFSKNITGFSSYMNSSRAGFSESKSLSNVTFEDGSKAECLGSSFMTPGNCPVESITFPPNAVAMGNSTLGWVFNNCTNVKMPDNIKYIYNSIDSSFPSAITEDNGIKYIDNVAFSASDKTLSSYTIKDGTRILLKTFAGCVNITSVGPIGSGADVEIPDSVVSIGNNCFSGCTNLESVILPDSVKCIEFSAFYNCNSLKRINSDIDGVFDLSNIDTFGYMKEDGTPQYVGACGGNMIYGTLVESLILPTNKSYSIGNAMLNGLYNLKRINSDIDGVVNIPDGVKYFGPDTTGRVVFSGTPYITTINVPDSVVQLGSQAFDDFENLTDLTIGSGLSVYGMSCVRNCPSLTSITINSLVVPQSPQPGFVVDYNENVRLYVPQSMVDEYKMDDRWGRDFKDRIFPIPKQ